MARARRLVSVLAASSMLAGAGLLFAAPASAITPTGTVTFQSDTTWGVYSSDPAAGPATSLGMAEEVCLNDASPYPGGCPSGAVNYGFSSAAWVTASPSGPMWLWASGVTDSTPVSTDPDIYISKTFDLAYGVQSATISIAADNDAEVFVNGHSVALVGSVSPVAAGSGSFDAMHSFTIPVSDFVAGNNIITVHAVNDTASQFGSTYSKNPAGVVFDGTITLNGYEPSGSCLGDPGHQILPPIKADGSSVFKQGSTVPAKFRVCDALGDSIGTPGVVHNFTLLKYVADAGTTVVNETVDSTTPDTAFRWDSTSQQWVFNISTKGLQAGYTYYYQITLNDGSTIDFSFALK